MSKITDAVREISDENEAEVQRMIAADPEDSDISEDEAAAARPFPEAFPDLAASIKRNRGRPVSDKPKKLVTLRLDSDIVERFEATGKGWRSRMNDALRSAKV